MLVGTVVGFKRINYIVRPAGSVLPVFPRLSMQVRYLITEIQMVVDHKYLQIAIYAEHSADSHKRKLFRDIRAPPVPIYSYMYLYQSESGSEGPDIVRPN